MREVMLALQDVSKSFVTHATRQVVVGCENVTLAVLTGEFVGITGRSGSGKSTVLRLIHRTYLPQTGVIGYRSAQFRWIDLAQASERQILMLRRSEIGYVSQFLQVIPRVTARDVVLGSARGAGFPADQAEALSERILTQVDLPRTLWQGFPHSFSGGEKLRLNIARALVAQPRLLLLDEPTASLDDESKGRVAELLVELKRAGTTMLGIFHDLAFMEGMCDREVPMQRGQING
jgi:alpha-D-ribose 1-methylphosphonate 5-triphosphate synthase subunit PhnL